MSQDALTVYPDESSIEACQAACHNRPNCQYFVWYDNNDNGTQCYLRDTVEYSIPDVRDASKSYVLFEVRGDL